MQSVAITPDDVARAAATIRGRIHRTPTFSSRSLDPGQHLKAELFQRTGSFKARGALNRVKALSVEERERGVISVSAGNHAQALAWAAATEGVDALLVMWSSASTTKIAATYAYGAAIDLEAADPAAAFSRLGPLTRRFPHAATVRFHLGVLLLWQRDVQEAKRQLRLARESQPGSRIAREAGRYLAELTKVGTD